MEADKHGYRTFAEELSEEDQQLKNELEMLVERLQVSCCSPRAPLGLLALKPRFETKELTRDCAFFDFILGAGCVSL